ncbi:hypothetical protein [Algoriphagus sediminis]|uniref:DUF4959 domain-containing protein n=1 Tax=Algoriphagus sediminis TaxID=3057113 RepID=A0ABT7Y984_9BACT|nr:hypothetical protein [Algoriphagus sediminis]MDN3203076.1 hypothetical protein [Algoriphagus sediminis]
MKKSLYFYIVLITCLFSCLGNEDPEPVNITDPDPVNILDDELRVNILPNYISNQNEVWVILHTLDGKPIDSRKIEGESSLLFKVDNSQRYHLTTYKKSEFNGSKVELLESFTHISVIEDLSLGLAAPATQGAEQDGEFNVEISHTSTPFGASVFGSNRTYAASGMQVGPRINLRVYRPKGSDEYFLMARDGLGDIRYERLNVPNPGVTITRTFSDLKPFDQVFSYPASNFSDFQFTCLGFKDSENSLEYRHIINTNQLGLLNDDLHPSLTHQIGFLDDIKNYHLIINGTRISSPNTSFTYHLIGPKPESLDLPESKEVQVPSTSISDFQVSISSEDTNWTAKWDQSEPFTGDTFMTLKWTIKGNESKANLTLPSELTEDKPKLQDLSKFSLQSVSLTNHSLSYDEQIRKSLITGPKIEPVKFTVITRRFE